MNFSEFFIVSVIDGALSGVVAVVCRLALLTTWLQKLLVFGRIKAGPMINDVISGVSELSCKQYILRIS